MMKFLITILLLASAFSASVCAAEQAEVLDRYVEVATALAADDFETAREASEKLSKSAEEAGKIDLSKQASAVSGALEIGDAREKFKMVSATIVPLAKGKAGFYIMNCPMTDKGDWVQKDPQVANPYFGKGMLHCGSIVEN